MRASPSNVAAALEYAARGIPVFPCEPNGKKPLTPHGFKDATTDTEQIRHWWELHPDANVAMPTGLPETWDVLDVDAPGDSRANGLATLRELERQHGKIAAKRVLSPSGGCHLYFRSGTLPRNGNGRLLGIDVKASGGYVLLPPSRVGSNGELREYQEVASVAVTDAPEWLQTLLTEIDSRNGGRNGRSSSAAPIGVKIASGERNTTLASLAGTMRRRGLSREATNAALQEENRLRCDPPLDADEVARIAASVSRYESQQSFQLFNLGRSEDKRLLRTAHGGKPVLRDLSDLSNLAGHSQKLPLSPPSQSRKPSSVI
jgi:putative DNA primase/helicase